MVTVWMIKLPKFNWFFQCWIFNFWLLKHRQGPHVLGLRETSRQITGPSILFPLRCILFPSVYCFNSFQFPSHCNSGKMQWPIFAGMISQCDCALWQVHAVLKQSIEVILRVELKESHCENLESIPAVFANLSWNFHLSPCGCSALAGNRQHITGLSIYYRDMPCFDGLYL